MPNGRRESYEAVPRRPEQQETKGPALSMSPVFSVPLLPCLKQTLSCLSSLLLIEPVHLLPCLSHTLLLSQTYPVPLSALCYSQNLFICYHVFLIPYSCLKHTLSLHQPSVTPRTCSSVTLSFSYPDPISNIPRPSLSPLLLPELVHLLPCLLLQATCLPVYSSTCQLATLPCLSHTLLLSQTYPVSLSTLSCPLILLTLSLPCHKKVKPYSFTFFFFPLLSLLIRSRAVTTKTYFVCPP